MTKLNDAAVLDAAAKVRGGVAIRSLAREMGVSHEALRKRLKALPPEPVPEPPPIDTRSELGGYSPIEVSVIVAVARAGIPGGLELMADMFGGSLLDVVEVARRYR